MKYIFLIAALIISIPSFSFDYNQKMIEYKGGIISELNNCGPIYTDSGKYLFGQRNITAKLGKSTSDFDTFERIGDGVVSLLSNLSLYYSPDGRFLDGGGSTKLLKILEKGVRLPNPRGEAWDLFSTSFSSFSENEILVLQVPKNDYVLSQTCGGRLGCVIKYGKRHDFYVFNIQTNSSQSYTSISQNRHIQKILGAANGLVYVQFYNGDVGIVNSVENLKNIDSIQIIHTAAPMLNKIVKYRHGLLAYNQTSAFWSNNPYQVISGSAVTQLYSGSKKITSMINYGGHRATESSLVPNASSGIMVAFQDGDVFFSPDGNNLTGGGGTQKVTGAYSESAMKSHIQAYFDSLVRDGYIYKDTSRGEPVYLSMSTGFQVNLKDISVTLLNRGSSKDYAKNTIFGQGNGTSSVIAMVSDFGGNPTSVRVYDKGWDGIEYKWRDRGLRSNSFAFNTEVNFIGSAEIRIRAADTCALAFVFSEIGGKVEPLSVYSTNLNADFTIAQNSAGSNSIINGFAAGGTQYPWSTDIFNRNMNSVLGQYPRNVTIMGLVTWSAFHFNSTILDLAGYPMKGPDIMYLQSY